MLPPIIIDLSFIGATPNDKSGDPLLFGHYPVALASDLRMSPLHLIVEVTLTVPGPTPSVYQNYRSIPPIVWTVNDHPSVWPVTSPERHAAPESPLYCPCNAETQDRENRKRSMEAIVLQCQDGACDWSQRQCNIWTWQLP
jgi:hypothetical protein